MTGRYFRSSKKPERCSGADGIAKLNNGDPLSNDWGAPLKDQKKTIIFLHGKQSTPEGSGSGKAIREHFSKEYNVLIPDYKPMERTHKEIETYLKEFISPHPEALIVGISLGGYWAYRMACVLPIDLGLSCVLLNPYFYNYPEIEVPMPPTNIQITVVVNMDDDLINPQEVIKRFQDTATIMAFETGGHRFKDKTPIVREVAATLQNSAK